MNVIEEIKRINEIELSKGITNTNASWHCKYANSAWIYIGNIPHNLTEGMMILCLAPHLRYFSTIFWCGYPTDLSYSIMLPFLLSFFLQGDIICVFSQFGEVEDFNLVRDETTGKSRGFAFLKYEDARSCILAVDNLTGSKVSSVLSFKPFYLLFFFDNSS
jgi:RNA-binding motif X-linked protein 2